MTSMLFIVALSFFLSPTPPTEAQKIAQMTKELNTLIANTNSGINAKIESDTAQLVQKEQEIELLKLCINENSKWRSHNTLITLNEFSSWGLTQVINDCSTLQTLLPTQTETLTSTWTATGAINPVPVKPVINPTTWLKNKDGQSKSIEELRGSTFNEISKNHNIPLEYWYDAERKYKIKKEVALCIAWADTGLGKQMKSTNNIGNVGNNDRGNVVHMDSLQKGVEAIFKTLNNKYLGYKQSIGSLSAGWGWTGHLYATSTDNWDKNTRNCLSIVHGVAITTDFKIRL